MLKQRTALERATTVSHARQENRGGGGVEYEPRLRTAAQGKAAQQIAKCCRSIIGTQLSDGSYPELFILLCSNLCSTVATK